MYFRKVIAAPIFLVFLLAACSDSGNRSGVGVAPVEPEVTPADPMAIYALANGCYNIADAADDSRLLVAGDGEAYTFSGASADDAARFLFRSADLGVYLLYDQNSQYLTSNGSNALPQTQLRSDTRKVEDQVVIDDRMQSEGEWELIAAENGNFQLRHLLSDLYLGSSAEMSAEPTDLSLIAADSCASFPELSLDAEGEVGFTEFEDGDVFGFVDAHSHLFTNFAFGGGRNVN